MSIGPGYACADCKTYLRPRKNEIHVLQTMDDEGTPYKIWHADLWECPDCGHQVILGYGQQHVAEHYEEGFAQELDDVTHTILGNPKVLPDRDAEEHLQQGHWAQQMDDDAQYVNSVTDEG